MSLSNPKEFMSERSKNIDEELVRPVYNLNPNNMSPNTRSSIMVIEKLDGKGDIPSNTSGIPKKILENINSLGDDDDQSIDKKSFAWVRNNNTFFVSARPNVESIPSGLYDIGYSQQSGIFLEKRAVILDEIFQIPDNNVTEIISDLQKFWTREDKYKEYGITYKRGILMYGPPGTGKTSLINILISQIINDYNGIVLNIEDLDCFIPMVNNIRCLEPDKPIMGIIEDLDGFVQYNSMKKFLNLLDGNLQVDNIVYLATTNYLDRLEDRIKNRPSRFDRRYEVGYPSDESRRFYLENKLKDRDVENINLDKWVTDTHGFTFSHLKELIVSVIVMDKDYQETISQLRSMYDMSEGN